MNRIDVLKDIITTKDGRKFTKLVGGFGEGCPILTDKQVGELLGYKKGARMVREQFDRNRDKFEENVDFIDLKIVADSSTLKELGYSPQSIIQADNIYIFSQVGFSKYLTISEPKNQIYIKDFIKEYFGYDGIEFNLLLRKENGFLEKLEEVLIPFDIKGVRQYNVLSYRMDYYIPSLNIAIEYDEEHHKHQQKEDKVRQKEIEYELGCKFIRVTDENSDEYNIGLIMKDIFDIKYNLESIIKKFDINNYINKFLLENNIKRIEDMDKSSRSKNYDYSNAVTLLTSWDIFELELHDTIYELIKSNTDKNIPTSCDGLIYDFIYKVEDMLETNMKKEKTN